MSVCRWVSRDCRVAHPLQKGLPQKLKFSLEFMDAWARAWSQQRPKGKSMKYAGIVHDHSERPDLIRQLPNDGVDIQDEYQCKSRPDLVTTQP